jgi:hypothetical protein
LPNYGSALYELGGIEITRFVTRARAAIHRVAGNPSVYVTQCEEIIETNAGMPGVTGRNLMGVLESLRADVEMGYLRSQRELLHGELLGDFLEMAQHLLDEGTRTRPPSLLGARWKPISGSCCVKSGVPVELESNSSVTPKKAERLQ